MMYYLQLPLIPLFFVMVLSKNAYKLMKKAIQWSIEETKSVYRSHRRFYNKDF